MSSIMRRRNGLIASSVMGDAPVLSEVANSSSSRQDASSRYRVAVPAARGALPRERFSPLALFGSAGTPRRCPLLGLIRTIEPASPNGRLRPEAVIRRQPAEAELRVNWL